MEFVSIDDFLDNVMPECAGCTEFTAQDRIRWAAIEFCRKTLVSQETSELLDLEANEPLLDLPSLSNNVLLYRILWMKNSKQFMKEHIRNSLADRNIRWDSAATGVTEFPPSYVKKSRILVHLFPTPEKNKNEEIEFHGAYIPSKKTQKLDAILIEEHQQAIVSGALSSLLDMSSEDWYNPRAADKHDTKFHTLLYNARAAVNKDFTTQDTVVQPVFFA